MIEEKFYYFNDKDIDSVFGIFASGEELRSFLSSLTEFAAEISFQTESRKRSRNEKETVTSFFDQLILVSLFFTEYADLINEIIKEVKKVKRLTEQEFELYKSCDSDG